MANGCATSCQVKIEKKKKVIEAEKSAIREVSRKKKRKRKNQKKKKTQTAENDRHLPKKKKKERHDMRQLAKQHSLEHTRRKRKAEPRFCNTLTDN